MHSWPWPPLPDSYFSSSWPVLHGNCLNRLTAWASTRPPPPTQLTLSKQQVQVGFCYLTGRKLLNKPRAT